MVESYYTDEWCVVKSILTTAEISGPDKAGISKAGELTKEKYAVVCKDQGGYVRDVNTVWTVRDRITGATPNGVSVDSEGTLFITSEASAGELLLSSNSVSGNENIVTDKVVVIGKSIAGNAAAMLNISDLTTDSPNAILSDLSLPQTGPLGTSVVWICDRSDVISLEGRVQRLQNDTSVTLTAKISDDFSSVHKSFELVVLGNESSLVNPISFRRTYFCDAGEDLSSPEDDKSERLYYCRDSKIAANTFVEVGSGQLEICMLTAIYHNNNLVDINVKTEQLLPNTKRNLYSAVNCDNADYSVKICFFESLGNLKPLTEYAVLRKAYYVSTDGNDNNTGGITAPFKTIQHAASLMKKGDTCVVREGVYRETVVTNSSGTETQPIIFTSYPGEKVTISGADELSLAWTIDSGNVYKASYAGEIKQLFVNDRMMNVARWPNAEVNNVFEDVHHAYAEDADYSFVSTQGLPSGDISGAKLYIWPGLAWNGFEREIIHTPGEDRLVFTESFPVQSNGLNEGDPWKPLVGNKFFIYGKRSLLDIESEWVQNENLLYLWPEGGTSPINKKIEIKARDWAFDVTSNNYIVINGFNIFAAAVRMRYTEGSLLKDCDIIYPSDNNQKSVYLRGNNNAVRGCHVSQTPGNGVFLNGENNIVYNCVVDHVNTCGDNYASVYTNGYLNRIVHNTFYSAGRSLILHYQSRKILISHNHLYEGGLLSKDLGATYTYGDNYGLGSQGSVISYNWVHDMGNETGIYLDSYSLGYLVHHNVVYDVRTAFVINGGSLNNLVCNNTMFRTVKGFFTATFPGHILTQKGTRILNNIISGTSNYATGEEAPEVYNNWNGAVDEQFLPYANSFAVDQGLIVEEITDDYVGNAPDIGAYELGGTYWTAGAAWEAPILEPNE